MNCFGIASGYQHCVELDHWVRMAYWRQLRKPRTKESKKLNATGCSCASCSCSCSCIRYHQQRSMAQLENSGN
ncbi:MAG TPA: hypothetical protein VJY57_08270 [Thiopseudomonas sp.]|nr:hypothetical protein [Thiopseudomonas sp.]